MPVFSRTRIHQTVETARAEFASGRTRSVEWRVRQLDILARLLTEHESEWEAALVADLDKHPVESQITEIGFVLAEIRHARKRLRRWMRGTRERVPLAMWPASARTLPEPRGTVLIMAPWNYPVQLLLAPLVGALAAGNTVVLKPSELAPATAELIESLFTRAFEPGAVAVVTGDGTVAAHLVEQDWDYIFFTGGDRVARHIARSAGERLIPVTLELGGKSPAFVDGTGNIDTVADRLVWAKFVNAGQTCVAPDYVLVTHSAKDRLIDALARAIDRRYGPTPLASDSYGRVVTARERARLERMLRDGDVVIGGDVDASANKMAPSVVTNVRPGSDLLTQEIFGPVLPVVEIDDAQAAIAYIGERPKPLAMSVMSSDARVWRAFVAGTSSGALDRNVGLAHMSVPGLPFGGVGFSGMGAYHGRRSFDTFSHAKAVFSKPLGPDTLRLIYPPYSPRVERFVRRLLRRLT